MIPKHPQIAVGKGDGGKSTGRRGNRSEPKNVQKPKASGSLESEKYDFRPFPPNFGQDQK